ncbi:MAG: hypothetical protein KKD07_10025 [Candidatus Omnitrophica bacterium]|nr:hypothetical protein [Candidatus Omnitrophota bacterium]MBU1995618.1 hypothetical protein [Candidatus Omnitrophota bacterium]MBU4334764.1 hypothetical protein [Candidatus Omnitrophota bacterium]
MKLGELTKIIFRISWRIAFLIYFLVVLIKHLTDPMYGSLLDPLNLGIHEVGHLLFSFAGMFLQVAGGTIFQIIAPIYGMYNFYARKEPFCIALCFGWLSTSLFDIATYAADARSMALPLVSPFGFGGNITHDWNFLLSRVGLINYDWLVARCFRSGAFVSMLICFILGAVIIRRIAVGMQAEES